MHGHNPTRQQCGGPEKADYQLMQQMECLFSLLIKNHTTEWETSNRL